MPVSQSCGILYRGVPGYQDVIHRLLDVILTIEQATCNVVVISDQVVIRTLTAYLLGHSTANVQSLPVSPAWFIGIETGAWWLEVDPL